MYLTNLLPISQEKKKQTEEDERRYWRFISKGEKNARREEKRCLKTRNGRRNEEETIKIRRVGKY